MSKNKELGLPRDKMKNVIVAFDIDGTLISNEPRDIFEERGKFGEPYKYDVPQRDIVLLLVILSKFKNVKCVVWSGGGQKYAQMWVDRLELNKWVWKTAGKMDLPRLKPDIAIDDIQDTDLGLINLIVRNK